ncbi:ABC-type ATPase fused to a predicted acetyltransferase domain [Pasteurella testudinis DSM 23072]|uniref:ABC-type ATPase fused to a predicted acetyltransferase domain n=1 Tax=Pasteurella testudinis DSM 23072 TaxID=1122938 RepID=A0A1W1V5C3_9PAST|nr:GNAT family N-acetyltransferase [Pasteurella testudinis]SMB88485.1 ABC-type ATPase fused to a predicted acetyltransferase domain [Pasteurella testudinis DSM 23072]SUB51623.1 cobalt transporter ATP-binding subunit [Pasteurella testudinis]
MQNFRVRLESPVSTSFRCVKAANSLDIDMEKKSVHELSVSADIESDFRVGLILGASGSGKTTLAKNIFGESIFDFDFDEAKPVIEQFPENMEYAECAKLLAGIGLTSVPCWIRPMYTLSNGQKARAIAALMMAKKDVFVIDEWTSVVDRTVAKAMSNCLQKFARSQQKTVIAISCHYDVVEWLNPDWIIDCNKQQYIERRHLWQNYSRDEKLQFGIKWADRKSWRYFSKYHYLSERLPGGKVYYFGLYHQNEQIGFIAYANYVPRKKGTTMQLHFNRLVIHPDYVGLGLGGSFVNETAKIMQQMGFDIRAKFSSVPTYKLLTRFPQLWKLVKVDRNETVKNGKRGNMSRETGFRKQIKTYSFKYTG